MRKINRGGVRLRLAGGGLLLLLLAAGAAADDTAPAWLFPLVDLSGAEPAYDHELPLSVAGSRVRYTEAELHDLFNAPDWWPERHGVAPAVVMHGHAPSLFACGFCHTASGQGRPENASLAGLPAEYIVAQVKRFASDERHAALVAYLPTRLMGEVARNATEVEVREAAHYFSEQTLRTHVVVTEVDRVPVAKVVGWVYVASPGSRTEPLGTRLLEFAPDAVRHEHRDDDLQYIAYVPPGSIQRGRDLASTTCRSCHGPDLRGVGVIPRLAGRSPSYLLRQLYAFKQGTRGGPEALPMRLMLANLDAGNLIDAVAYAASLPP